MIKLKDILNDAASLSGGYGADSGEPDTGFIRGGRTRKLGKLEGKPEPWFDNGGYTQMHWPQADYIYGQEGPPEYAFSAVKRVVILDNMIKLKDILRELDGGAPLVAPDGTIQGAPTPKQVKKIRKQLDTQEDEEELDEVDFHSQNCKLNKPSAEDIKQNLTLITNETEESLDDEGEVDETIKKVDGKYVVYPKKGGKRLGTHATKSAALKQLAAIEINKSK